MNAITPNGKLWVYKNNGINGAIAFAPPVIDTLGGASYENIAITDFDGDGKPDLASSNNNSNVVAVARNTSNTSIISFDTPLLISLNYLQSLSVAVGDFDRDGKMDMAVSCDYNQLLIFRNISSPGKIMFENPVFITTNNSGGTTVVADFDNDDRSDISLSNHYYNKVSVFRNTGNIGSIQFAAGIDYQTGTNTYNLATGDINGDGKPDLVAANIISNSISIFQNNSTNGVISFSNKVDYFTGSGPAKVSLADFDNDGKTDIAVANNNSDIIAILRNRIREPNIVALCPNSNTSITSNITGANYQWQASPDSFFQNISNNSYYNGTNSSTLQLTGLPSSWYGYEYRCLVNGNYSKVFKIKFVNNWTGVVDSSWENPNNWSCGTMPDENTDVVISSGTMVLNSNTTCRSITVKPGATFTIYTGFTLTVTH